MLNQTSETSTFVSGPVKGRRTAVFVLWIYTEPTMEVLNKVLWLVKLLSNHGSILLYSKIQKWSKSSTRVYIRTCSSPTPPQLHLPHLSQSSASTLYQACTIKPNNHSHINLHLHSSYTFHPSKMAPPQTPSWLVPAVKPGLYFNRRNGNELYLTDDQVRQLFRREMHDLWVQSK